MDCQHKWIVSKYDAKNIGNDGSFSKTFRLVELRASELICTECFYRQEIPYTQPKTNIYDKVKDLFEGS